MKIKKNSVKVKNQSTHEISSNKTYNDWVYFKNDEKNNNKKINEPSQANPENIAEDKGYFFQSDTSKETTERVKKLLEYAPRFLTEKQWRVFELLAIQLKEPKHTATVLGISRSTVDKHFKAAQKRLQKLYETL